MQLRCECGFAAVGRGVDEVFAAAAAHARDVHDVRIPRRVLLRLLAGSVDGADAQSAGQRQCGRDDGNAS